MFGEVLPAFRLIPFMLHFGLLTCNSFCSYRQGVKDFAPGCPGKSGKLRRRSSPGTIRRRRQIGEKPRTFRSTCTRSIVYFRPQLAAKKRTRK
jgi:hypothetical protein